MKTGKRKVVLTTHFLNQWRERMDNSRPGQIKHRLRDALNNKPIFGIDGGFAVKILGRTAVCVIDYCGSWVFITLLDIDMNIK